MKSLKSPLISLQIVNYNGLEFLDDCFKSIYSQTYKNIEVIMVDNNSSDKSIEFTKKNYPKVKIVKSKNNSGFAGGHNLAYKYTKGEYVMIINNDIILQKDLIEKLLQAYKEIPKLGAVQPMYKLIKDKKSLDACGSFWTDTGFNYHYGIYKDSSLKKYHKSFPIYSLKGVCMLIPRKVIEKVGLFDDDFWCYFEETDFCHRVWLAGYECWYYPKSFLYHVLSGTRSKKSEAFIQFHSFKNRLCSYTKNLSVIEYIKVIPIYLFLNVVFSVIAYLLKGRFDCFASIYKAMWWNITHLKSTLKKRQYIQKNIRIKSDKEIFSIVRRNPRLEYYYYLSKGLENYED
jgi:GT2 family glycosyltransferase